MCVCDAVALLLVRSLAEVTDGCGALAGWQLLFTMYGASFVVVVVVVVVGSVLVDSPFDSPVVVRWCTQMLTRSYVPSASLCLLL